jgi:hypothetical protein
MSLYSILTFHRVLQFNTHELIRMLADRLGHHGVETRAQAIFDSAMQRTSMKWGKATKLAAGAALVFAMREQGRGDRTHHVAVSPSSLSPSSIFFDTNKLFYPFCVALSTLRPSGHVLAPLYGLPYLSIPCLQG